ncbi:hypothetical protein Taro_030574 [Colocasia esculenta]|uniref:Auxin-responsive protein n=1 Tax=Colocasia esculenta TaxID=4460 RepID=A0A843W3Q2_COLES|nr:hypothetical protein [Colocasia esculenta]
MWEEGTRVCDTALHFVVSIPGEEVEGAVTLLLPPVQRKMALLPYFASSTFWTLEKLLLLHEEAPPFARQRRHSFCFLPYFPSQPYGRQRSSSCSTKKLRLLQADDVTTPSFLPLQGDFEHKNSRIFNYMQFSHPNCTWSPPPPEKDNLPLISTTNTATTHTAAAAPAAAARSTPAGPNHLPPPLRFKSPPSPRRHLRLLAPLSFLCVGGPSSVAMPSKAAEEAGNYRNAMASEVSSSFPARPSGVTNGDGGRWPGAGEADLELGLGLGASKAVSGVRKVPDGGAAPWRECCRILTARDFPSMVASRGSPISSPSSSASSCPSPGGGDGGGERGKGGVGVAGSKRAADPASPPEMRYRSPSQVVGWPPIRAYRMNSLMNQSKDNLDGDNSDNGRHKIEATGRSPKVHNNGIKEDAAAKEDEKRRLASVSLFVKVKMDGMPIGRKVDLSAHRAYETLALALEDMFQKPSSIDNPNRHMAVVMVGSARKTSKLLDGSSEFVLTYEDKDGDWLLAGDVPWRMFLSTVKRLRIMRTSDANGLAPRFQASRIGLRS